MAGGTEAAMGRYSLVARFGAPCGREPREYTERTAGSLPAGLVALPVIIRFFRSHGYRFVRL